MIDVSLSYAKVREWAASKPADETIGVAVSLGCCPIATYLTELNPGHAFEVSNYSIQIDGEKRCILPEWAISAITRVDCNVQGTEIPAATFLRVLDAVKEWDESEGGSHV